MNLTKLKDACFGKWGNIVPSLTQVSVEKFNAKHQPCPKCGGEDRFRAFDDFEETGGCLCNKCGTFASGLDTICWLQNIDIEQSAERVAEHVGFKKRKAPPAKREPAKQLEISEWNESLAGFWVDAKPGTTSDGLRLSGARPSTYQNATVFAWPIIGPDLNLDKPSGYVVSEYCGRPLVVYDKNGKAVDSVKIKTLSGSDPGLVGTTGVERLKIRGIVRKVFKVEGVPDLVALQGIIPPGLIDEVVVITNSDGAMADSRWIAPLLAEIEECYVIGDADLPGQNGAAKWAAGIMRAGGAPKLIHLPFPVVEKHGKDLRDWIAEGNGFGELLSLADNAVTIAPEADLDELMDQKANLRLAHLEVISESPSGQVKMYSYALKKTSVIRSISRFTYMDLCQIGGCAASDVVAKPYVDARAGQISFADVVQSIALVASSRRDEPDEVSHGVWAGDCHTIVLANDSHASRYNGDRVWRKVEAPRVDGLVVNFGVSRKDWYDHDELGRLLDLAVEPDWRQENLDRLVKILQSWVWRNPTHDPVLTAGLLCASWLQTTWPWRPLVSVYGESGAGKSVFFQFLCGSGNNPGFFGGLGEMICDATEAGLRQLIKSSGMIICYDEFEGSPHRAKILQLLRSSTRGNSAVRGTANGGTAANFQLRHMIWVGATETGIEKQPDLNRFVELEMLMPTQGTSRMKLPEPRVCTELGMRILASLIYQYPKIKSLYDTLVAYQPASKSLRSTEIFAAPAACLAALQGLSDDEARELMDELLKTRDADSDNKTDYHRLFVDILTSHLAYGGDLAGRSVESVLCSVTDRENYADILRSVGVFPMPGGEKVLVQPDIVRRKLLKGTEWETQRIGQHLKRISGAERRNVRIGAGNVIGYVIPFDLEAANSRPGATLPGF